MTETEPEPLPLAQLDRTPRIAVYAGSFDPPTNGHWDIIKRASGLFDHLIVAVGHNTRKKAFMPASARVEALSELTRLLPNCSAPKFEGLLADYARKKGACSIIRGLRPNGDFDNEFLLAAGNKDLAPDIETVWLATSFGNSYVSSGLVREVAIMSNDDRWLKWVPEEVKDIVEPYIIEARNPLHD